jgi:hypothetical protein
MEAILGAGHIPAAMEQFSPGDETALEKIKAWIDESDAFILILGGRYGSIEPLSGKSYVQLEYEYAVEKKKPFFAIVISKEHHEERVKKIGLHLDERENQQKYKEFKQLVTQRLCGFWNDRKDIKTAVFQKLPEWAQRADLIGWVRADEATSPETANELARLSRENRELRAAAKDETFDGLSFDEMVEFLSEQEVTQNDLGYLHQYHRIGESGKAGAYTMLQMFEALFEQIASGKVSVGLNAFTTLTALGLTTVDGTGVHATSAGRRLRNKLMLRTRSEIEQD